MKNVITYGGCAVLGIYISYMIPPHPVWLFPAFLLGYAWSKAVVSIYKYIEDRSRMTKAK